MYPALTEVKRYEFPRLDLAAFGEMVLSTGISPPGLHTCYIWPFGSVWIL
jgi:hypothetical protein